MARRAQVLGSTRQLGSIGHTSYSTLTTWFDCPKQVELRKIRRAPATPAWWFAGGSAVHSATEEYDRWTLLDPVSRPKFSIVESFGENFRGEVAEIEEKEPDRTKWRHAGPKTAPETYDKWMRLGPVLVGNYISWRRNSDYVIWTHHDEGATTIGIETDLSCTLPGCEMELKAYADRIFFSPSLEQLHIVDLKTGSRGPRNGLQFGTYAACLAFKYDYIATTGAAFMNREGALGKPFSLEKYTPNYVGRLFSNLERAVRNDVFPAHQGSSCRMCDVQDACFAVDGPLAERYDPDHPGYAPDF